MSKKAMYKTFQNEKLYLYDTQKKQVVKVFNSVYDVREYIDQLVFNCMLCGDYNFKSPYWLTMSLKPVPVSMRELYWDEDEMEYVVSPAKYQIYKNRVIIDEDYRIFNYMEIVNELKAHYLGQRITYGIGHTYKGDPNTPPNHILQWYRSGRKRTHRSYPHLTINKRERTDSYDVPDEIIIQLPTTEVAGL